MILIKKLICLCLVVSALMSCGNSSEQKEVKEKNETAGTTTNSGDDNIIKFSVNGADVNSKGHNISRFSMGGKVWLNITSSMHIDGRTVNMNIERAEPGTYSFGGGIKTSHGGYYPSYLKEITNAYDFISGVVMITSVDTINNLVNATFSGFVQNDKNEKLEIKNGQVINGKLTKGITKF